MAENCEKVAGTARSLHEFAELESMIEDFGEEAALAIATREVRKSDASFTHADLKGAIKFRNACISGAVNLAAARQEAEDRAKKAAAQLFPSVVDHLDEI